jgi:hypothetical protein
MTSLCNFCLQIDNLHKLIFVDKSWPTYLCIGCLKHIYLASACETKSDLTNELEDKTECEEFPKVGDMNYVPQY